MWWSSLKALTKTKASQRRIPFADCNNLWYNVRRWRDTERIILKPTDIQERSGELCQIVMNFNDWFISPHPRLAVNIIRWNITNRNTTGTVVSPAASWSLVREVQWEQQTDQATIYIKHIKHHPSFVGLENFSIAHHYREIKHSYWQTSISSWRKKASERALGR